MATTHDAPGRATATATPATPRPAAAPTGIGAGAGGPARADVGTPDSPAVDRLEHLPRRNALVGAIVGTLVTSALAMATFVWYRWQAVNEPTTAVIVEGRPALDGAIITVTGSRVVTNRLTAANNFVASILLEPGQYRVTAQHQGREILRHDVMVERFLGVRIRLPGPDPARGPNASAATATRPLEPGTP